MPEYHIICPATSRPVSTGVEVTAGDESNPSRLSEQSLVCPLCRQTHTWGPEDVMVPAQQPSGPRLITHRRTILSDQTVYLTGHAYVECRLERCTIVYRGDPGVLTGCQLVDCILHIDTLIHDADVANTVIALVSKIREGMPGGGPADG